MLIFLIILTALLTGADQLIKLWAVKELAGTEISRPFISIGSKEIINLTYTENTGAAFSMMSGKAWFTIGFTTIALILFAVYMIKNYRHSGALMTVTAIVIAGGLGNLIDRIRLGYVVDYLEVRLFRFAIFNFADVCVTVGMVLLVLILFISESRKKLRRKLMDKIETIAGEEFSGARIDKYIGENIQGISRSSAAKMLSDGSIQVNGIQVNKNYKLKTGDCVTVVVPDPVELEAQAENIPVDIVYEDDYLLVVNKPKGMVVHPAAGNYTGTLVNALLYHCSGRLSSINGVIRPGIVHRIDKNTSGLLIVAKTDEAHNGLAAQIKEHSFTREYEAVVERMKEMAGTVDAPVGRSKTDRKKMCVTDQNSKNAVTHYEVLEELGSYTYLRLRLETGRTHQIRVHMKYIGHPVLGDDVYGKPYKGIDGQCLHARKIGFIHPVTGEYLEFTSELPEYFQNILTKLRKSR